MASGPTELLLLGGDTDVVHLLSCAKPVGFADVPKRLYNELVVRLVSSMLPHHQLESILQQYAQPDPTALSQQARGKLRGKLGQRCYGST